MLKKVRHLVHPAGPPAPQAGHLEHPRPARGPGGLARGSGAGQGARVAGQGFRGRPGVQGGRPGFQGPAPSPPEVPTYLQAIST